MQFVAGDQVGQRQDGNRILAGNAAALPSFFIQRTEESHAGAAHVGILVQNVGKRAVIEPRAANEIILLKTFERRLVPASDAQCAVGENAFGIGDDAQEPLLSPSTFPGA